MERWVPAWTARFACRMARSRDGLAETERPWDLFLAGCEAYFAWSGCLSRKGVPGTAGRRHDPLLPRSTRWWDSAISGRRACWTRTSCDPAGRVAVGDGRSRRPGATSDCTRSDGDGVESSRMTDAVGAGSRVATGHLGRRLSLRPKDASGEDTYVLCEINVSAVWPFPPMAARHHRRGGAGASS